MIGWGGKDFRWGGKVGCNSAAKNHPSAPPLETVNNTYVTFIIVKVSSSPLKQILFIPDVGKIHNNTAHVSPEKIAKRKNERKFWKSVTQFKYKQSTARIYSNRYVLYSRIVRTGIFINSGSLMMIYKS